MSLLDSEPGLVRGGRGTAGFDHHVSLVVKYCNNGNELSLVEFSYNPDLAITRK